MICIYKISSPSGRVYIGQTRNYKKRMQAHRELKKQSKQPKLFRSYQKYGYDAHKFEVAHEFPPDISIDVVNQYEKLYMQLYSDCGIDLLNTKEGGWDGRHSAETLAKIGISKIGNKNMLGKKHSEETRAKIRMAISHIDHSARNRGRIFREDSRKKMSESRMGVPPWNKGKKGEYNVSISNEERARRSQASLEFWKKIKKDGDCVSLHGEAHPGCKLTVDKVKEIRRLLSEKQSCASIARKFGVSNSLIYSIRDFKRWKHDAI